MQQSLLTVLAWYKSPKWEFDSGKHCCFRVSDTLSMKRWDDFLQGLDELHKGKGRIIAVVEIPSQRQYVGTKIRISNGFGHSDGDMIPSRALVHKNF